MMKIIGTTIVAAVLLVTHTESRHPCTRGSVRSYNSNYPRQIFFQSNKNETDVDVMWTNFDSELVKFVKMPQYRTDEEFPVGTYDTYPWTLLNNKDYKMVNDTYVTIPQEIFLKNFVHGVICGRMEPSMKNMTVESKFTVQNQGLKPLCLTWNNYDNVEENKQCIQPGNTATLNTLANATWLAYDGAYDGDALYHFVSGTSDFTLTHDANTTKIHLF
eukprot:Pgem_evm1s13245